MKTRGVTSPRPVALHWPGRPAAAPPPRPRALTPLLRFPARRDESGSARLLCGDALAAMDRMLDEGRRFDLVHIDPPFGSDADYCRRRSVTVGDAKVEVSLPAYGDNDGGDVAGYLDALYPIFCRARSLLLPHGALYLHIDFRRGPHLRLLLDEVFGADALLNEIVWAYALGGSSKRRFQRKHDSIFFYAKEPGKHYFAPPREAATSSMLAGRPKLATDTWVTASREDDAAIDRDWPDQLVRKTMSNRDPERTGYGTQKPLALANRIVSASCPPGGTVFDPMCGSGTIGVAAVLLGRHAVLNDRGLPALDVTRARLLAAGAALQVDAVDDGPQPRRWRAQPPVAIDDTVATLRWPRSQLQGVDPSAVGALRADPCAAVGAWGVGARAVDGALEMHSWHDLANLRNAPPVQPSLAADACDSWWCADVMGRQHSGALSGIPDNAGAQDNDDPATSG